MSMDAVIKWGSINPHNFTAACTYLDLELDSDSIALALDQFTDAHIVYRRANDILRAARRKPLPKHDLGVKRDLHKIKARKPIAPVLLVQWDYGFDIADGYHRVCAAWHYDQWSSVAAVLAHV